MESVISPKTLSCTAFQGKAKCPVSGKIGHFIVNHRCIFCYPPVLAEASPLEKLSKNEV
jgi:hypothetical protein